MAILHYLSGNIFSFVRCLFSTKSIINLSDDELHKKDDDANWLKRVYLIIAMSLGAFYLVGGFICAIIFFGLLLFNKTESAYAFGGVFYIMFAYAAFPLALVEFYEYVNKTLCEIYRSELASRSLITDQETVDYFI